MDLILFYVFGAVAVLASLFVVGQRHPMYSVLLLILSFGALSGLYVVLDAPFVAVIQIIIYAGAIMVLFLFVVMLLNAHKEGEESSARAMFGGPGPRRFGAVLSVLLVAQLGWALTRIQPALLGEPAPGIDSVREIGRRLFTDYAFAFEATSLLILVAMVGAVVLAGRRDDEARGNGAGQGAPASDRARRGAGVPARKHRHALFRRRHAVAARPR